MRRYNNKTKPTLDELHEKWNLKFLAEYAELKIMNSEGNTILIKDIENDKRRIGSVSRYFIDLGWADPDESYWGVLTPIDEVIEKILPDYAVEHQFRTDGKKLVSNYHNREAILNSVTDAFVCINNLGWEDEKGLIYIYTHRNDYVFRDETARNEEIIRYAFPKKLLSVCDNNILVSHAERYCKEHPVEIIRKAFHLKFRYIGRDIPSYSFSSDFDGDERGISGDKFRNCFGITDTVGDNFFFENTRYEKPVTIDRNITYLERVIKVTKGAIREWKVLKRIIERSGGNEKFKQILIESALEVFQEEAPIWSMNGDKNQKAIAELIIKGTSAEAA